jgi:lysophospholipase L1-like esterase
MRKNIKWLLLVSLSFVACNNNDDDSNSAEVPITSGSASFAKYVALGDSFAAGYSDGALFKAGQQNSYVNILAQQFIPAGGAAVTTPFMLDDLGGFSNGGVQIPKFPTRLYFDGVGPRNVSGVTATGITSHLTGQFTNMGIPGAKSYHLIAPNFGDIAGVFASPATANPYFARFSSSPTTTVLADALAQRPTFFSLWIGGNDVLGYATNGGVPTAQDPVSGDDITPVATFDFVYNTLITNLTANGAKGVVANLPYITALPYFTTVPYNPVVLTEDKVAPLNAAYAQYNDGLKTMVSNSLLTAEEAARRTIKFTAGSNALVIVDSYLTDLTAYRIPSYRQATKEDLIVLLASEFLKNPVGGDPTKINGVTIPLADKWVLSVDEITEVKTATDAYNTTIDAIAKAKGLAFVDTKEALIQLSSDAGVRFGNYQMTATYVKGGAFSLDGVHPTPRGYAYIANLFINAINVKYGATLRTVDLAQYQTLFPKTIH